MIVTTLDLIKSAMRLIRALGTGEEPTAAEASDALQALNLMLESWSTKSTNIFTTRIDLFYLTANQAVHTIGVDPEGLRTPDWAAPRPLRIVAANVVLSAPSYARVPITLLRDTEWASKRVRTVQSTFPIELYNDGASPLSSLYFWPIANTAQQIELFTWQALELYDDLTSVLTLPPGYMRAIKYSLAEELAVEFGADVPAAVATAARNSRAAIAGLNTYSPRTSTIPYDGSRGGSGFNWLTGQ